jgi:hypothetical protein
MGTTLFRLPSRNHEVHDSVGHSQTHTSSVLTVQTWAKSVGTFLSIRRVHSGTFTLIALISLRNWNTSMNVPSLDTDSEYEHSVFQEGREGLLTSTYEDIINLEDTIRTVQSLFVTPQ